MLTEERRKELIAKKEAIWVLKSCQQNDDVEIAHGDADDALCNLLVTLGYKDVVEEYNKVDKWYA